MAMAPPWSLQRFVLESLKYQQGMPWYRFWALVWTVWVNFDRMQQQDWAEYQDELRKPYLVAV